MHSQARPLNPLDTEENLEEFPASHILATFVKIRKKGTRRHSGFPLSIAMVSKGGLEPREVPTPLPVNYPGFQARKG
jgi:hypothetical protein